MKLKGKKKITLVLFLALLVISIGLLAGCVRGTVAVGWSGGSVVDGNLYVASNEGRLVRVDLADGSILRADPLRVQQQGGLLSCAALGCGGGTTTVPIYSTPVVTGDLVYIAGYNGKILAYRTDNLAERWVYPREGYLQAFVGGPVVYENKLFIGCSDGNVYALDAVTGDLLYTFRTGDKIWGTPAVDAESGTLYIGSYDKNLYALNTADLTLKWSYETEGSIISTPLIENDIVYFGSFDRNIYAVNAADGTLVWQFTGDNWFWAQPALLNGLLYAPCMDNFVYVLDPVTGAAAREPYDLGSGISSSPAIVGDLIVFASRQGLVFKVDSTNGEIKQVADLAAHVDGPLASDGEIVYIHSAAAEIVRVNPVTETILTDIPLQSGS